MLLYQYLINTNLEYCKAFLKRCIENKSINLRVPLSCLSARIVRLNSEVIKKLECDNKEFHTRHIKKMQRKEKLLVIFTLMIERDIFCVEPGAPKRKYQPKPKGGIIFQFKTKPVLLRCFLTVSSEKIPRFRRPNRFKFPPEICLNLD